MKPESAELNNRHGKKISKACQAAFCSRRNILETSGGRERAYAMVGPK